MVGEVRGEKREAAEEYWRRFLEKYESLLASASPAR